MSRKRDETKCGGFIQLFYCLLKDENNILLLPSSKYIYYFKMVTFEKASAGVSLLAGKRFNTLVDHEEGKEAGMQDNSLSILLYWSDFIFLGI